MRRVSESAQRFARLLPPAAAADALEIANGLELQARARAQPTRPYLILNMISTGVMIRLGHVYGNLMVNVQPTNQKLEDRARRIIEQAAGVTAERAAELLEESGRSVRTAIVMEKKKVSREQAEALLRNAGGKLRVALL